ncbi:MAG: 16S rRNA (cytosine(1402)-N(4))-methyltransferase RsmH [Candidatus Wildermuthbacteria bacterium]|nr:16S rRNA (cytosine(1402)-N(4))-methyltransferase RsmH [Candidatus Wildermuthbacteria bacterium]
MTEVIHQPVLLKEVLECLSPQPNENFIDCTLGEAGHTLALLERTNPHGKVLGLELNEQTLEKTKARLKASQYADRVAIAEGNFADLQEIAKGLKFAPVHGILLDLGFSSLELEQSERGFSFRQNEPLDMRFSAKTPETAADIVNTKTPEEIEQILKECGEERFARQIARAIANERNRKRIETTFQLVEIIGKAVPAWYKRQRLHFATRTFQALRIAVNSELENLSKVLAQAIEILEPNGRIAIISFHSLEDRIIKQFFRSSANLEVITKKPVSPSKTEIQMNPRSRSAKLRAAIKK